MEVLSSEEIGRPGGFYFLRRLRLRNRRADGSRSREWLCDFVARDRGLDAVVLVLWRLGARDRPEVLLREGLRPALHYGRTSSRLALPDRRAYFFFTEVVAGIVEPGEVGEAALRQRATEEAWEEAGVRLDPAAVELLGAGSFPSPGMTPEKLWFCAARAPMGPTPAPEGDGSPMEEGARTRWMPLAEAIDACTRGEIEDAKTELGLRRLAARLL